MNSFPPTINAPDSDDEPEIEMELNQISNNFTALLDVKKTDEQERPLSPIATRRWNIVRCYTCLHIGYRLLVT